MREAVGPGANDAEILVVAPALTRSHLRFHMSDADDAIARAEEAQEETVERLGEEGLDAAGDTGESDPLLAIQDALQTFDADRIVVFHHPSGDTDLGEDWLQAREIERRFDRPAEERVVTR